MLHNQERKRKACLLSIMVIALFLLQSVPMGEFSTEATAPGNETTAPPGPDMILTGNCTINSTLYVESGVWIRFENANIFMNSTYDGEVGIDIKGSGKLELINSTMQRADERASFFFKAEQWSILRITNSSIHGCGYGDLPEEKGLYIATSDAIVIDSRLDGGEYGIFVENSSPNIGGSLFENNTAGIFSKNSEATISSCTFVSNTFGYRGVASHDHIESCIFEENRQGANFMSGKWDMKNCSITRGAYGLYMSSTTGEVSGVFVDGATYALYTQSSSVKIENSTLESGIYGIYMDRSSCRLNSLNISDTPRELYITASTCIMENSSLGGRNISASGGGVAIMNTTIPMDEEICATEMATMNLINTTGNRWDSHGLIYTDRTSLVRYGNYADLIITDESGDALPDSSVIVAAGGLPVFGGMTGSNGRITIPFINWTVDGSGERDMNTTIYAYSPQTPENLSGSFSGPIEEEKEISIVLRNESESGVLFFRNLTMKNEAISGGAVLIGPDAETDASSNITISNSTIILTDELQSNGALNIRNSSILSGRADVAQSPDPPPIVINQGSSASFYETDLLSVSLSIHTDECNISLSRFERCQNAIYVNGASPSINNSEINNCLTGIESSSSSPKLTDSRISRCDVGFREYLSGASMNNISFNGCSIAVDSDHSTSLYEGVNISEADTAFSLHYSGVTLERCFVNATATDIYCISSSPTISNSTLKGETTVRAMARSFPAALNTTVGENDTSVDRTSFISLGRYGTIRTVNGSDDAIVAEVSIFDNFGACSHAITNKSGLAHISWRYGVIRENGVEKTTPETVSWAEGGSGILFARRNYTPNMTIKLLMNSSIVYYKTPHYVPASGETVENTTVILGSDITVPIGRKLTIRSSEVFAGKTQFRIFGSFEIEKSHVRESLNRRPCLSDSYFPYFWNSQMSWINNSIFDNPTGIVSYNRNLEINGLTIRNAGSSAIYLRSPYHTMKNISIDNAGTGISISEGWPNLENVKVTNCTTGISAGNCRGWISNLTVYGCKRATSLLSAKISIFRGNISANDGVYASGGELSLIETTIRAGGYGAIVTNGIANIKNSTVKECDRGIVASNSAVHITKTEFSNNKGAGLSLAICMGELKNSTFRENGIGLYLRQSAPTIRGDSFWKNGVGIKAERTYFTIESCFLRENRRGIETRDAAINLLNSTLLNNTIGLDMSGDYTGDIIGQKRIYTTFMKGGEKHLSIPLPQYHTLQDVRITLTGQELGWVPVVNDPYIQRDAHISGNTAVWADYRSGNYDVYMRDLSADTDNDSVPDIFELPFRNDDIQLTSAPNSQGIPAVSGPIIAWKDFNTNGTGRVMLYSTENRTAWPITPYADLSDIALSGSIVAWSQNTGTHRDIFAYSLRNSTVWRVTYTPDDEHSPSIWEDRMVWYSSNITLGSARSNIVFYNITTGKTYNITDDSYLEFNPSIWGNRIAWHDNSRGDGGGGSVEIVKIISIGADGVPGTADDLKVGESNGRESAFNPSLSEYWAVWYSHNSTTGICKTMAMNLTTGKTERLSYEEGIDCQPRVSGSRVIRMDKTDSDWDVYVMDLNSRGVPSNVSADLNSGDYGRRNTTGDLTSMTFGYPVADAHKTGDLTANISSDTAGIVEMEIKATMRVTSFIGFSTIRFPDSADFTGIHAEHTTISMENTSMHSDNGWPESATAFSLYDSSVDSLNCSIGWGGMNLSGNSGITVRNYLDILVRNESGGAIQGAAATVTDNGVERDSGITSAEGRVWWLIITDRMILDSGVSENTTVVSVSYPLLFPDNPRHVNMSGSHTEVFTSDENAPKIWMSTPEKVYAGGDNLTMEWSISDSNIVSNGTIIYLQNMATGTRNLVEDNMPPNGNFTITLPLENGWFSVEVLSTDEVGHTGENGTPPFYIDSERPEIELVSPANGSIIPGGNITLLVSDHTNISVLVSADGLEGNWNFSSPDYDQTHAEMLNISTEEWPEGDITLTVEVVDEAGNRNGTAFEFSIDRTAPEIITEPCGPVIRAGPEINYSVADEHAVETVISVNGRVIGSYIDSHGGSISTSGWGDGEYLIEITATDAAGNSARIFRNLTIDNTAPLFSLPNGDVAGAGERNLPILISDLHLYHATVITPFRTEDMELSGTEETIELNISGWADGNYGISVQAEDEAGNRATFVFTLIVDRQGPVFSVTYPESANTEEGIPLTFNITDLTGLQSLTLSYRENGANNWTTITLDLKNRSATIPPQSRPTTLEFYLKGADSAGNVGTSRVFLIDITEQTQNESENSTGSSGGPGTSTPDYDYAGPPAPLYAWISLLIILAVILIVLLSRRRREDGKKAVENADIEEEDA